MKIRIALAALTLLFAPLATGGAVQAHGSMKPQHGGIVQMTGETLFELVKTKTGVELYITEEDEPIASSGASAKLSITNGAKTTSATLEPAGGNKFVGKGVKLPGGAKVVVTLVSTTTKAKTFATFLVK